MLNKNEDFVIHNIDDSDNNISSSDLDKADGLPTEEEIVDDDLVNNDDLLDIKDIDEIDSDLEASTNEKNSKFLLNTKTKDTKTVNTEDIDRRNKDNITSARSVIIDLLEGTTKKSEAMDYARGFIDNHYPSPSSCYIYVMPYEDSYVVEIHDGGDGRAYLPNIIKILEDDPTACACIQNKTRILEIKKSNRGFLSSILLPEGIDSVETNIVKAFPSDKPDMKKYSFNNLMFVSLSLGLCALSFIFFVMISVASLLSYQKPIKILPTTEIRNLPIQQWDNLIDNYSHKKYVEKLSFNNDRWAIIQKNTSAELDVNNKTVDNFVVSENEVDIKDEDTSILMDNKENFTEENPKEFLIDNSNNDISIMTRDSIQEEISPVIHEDIENNFNNPIEDEMDFLDTSGATLDKVTNENIIEPEDTIEPEDIIFEDFSTKNNNEMPDLDEAEYIPPISEEMEELYNQDDFDIIMGNDIEYMNKMDIIDPLTVDY